MSSIQKDFVKMEEIENEIYAKCDKLDELNAVIAGEAEGDEEQAIQALEEFNNQENLDAEIEPYTLDKLFGEIKYKRKLSRDGKLEDGEVDISSDECEPYDNETGDTNKDPFGNILEYGGTCTN